MPTPGKNLLWDANVVNAGIDSSIRRAPRVRGPYMAVKGARKTKSKFIQKGPEEWSISRCRKGAITNTPWNRITRRGIGINHDEKLIRSNMFTNCVLKRPPPLSPISKCSATLWSMGNDKPSMPYRMINPCNQEPGGVEREDYIIGLQEDRLGVSIGNGLG